MALRNDLSKKMVSVRKKALACLKEKGILDEGLVVARL